MVRAVFLFLLFWTAASSAHFSSGVLGLKWGSTLEQVQAIYPGGTSWPNGPENRNGEIVYAVPGRFNVLALEIQIPLVHFIFSKENTLERVFLHFRYADREAALYGTALALGQDYSIRDETNARVFLWKTGTRSRAKLEVGNGPQFPWSFLAVGSVHEKPDIRK